MLEVFVQRRRPWRFLRRGVDLHGPNEIADGGEQLTGHVGDADPMAAISDTLHEREVDEIIISTLPRRLSRWMRLDLPSKVRGLGKPVTHVEAVRAPTVETEVVDDRAA